MSESPAPVVEVADLSVTIQAATGPVEAVVGAHLRVMPGEVLALVGESGSGKSTLAMTVAGLAPEPAEISGRVRLEGRDLTAMSEPDLREVRGDLVGVVFQDPGTSFNPVLTIGTQIAEVLRRHRDLGRGERGRRVVDLLESAGLPEPAAIARAYPHQLSGGMQQRAMIALATACRPRLLVADEPTSALDVTVQVRILDLLRSLAIDRGTAVLLVTHDFGVVADVADRVAVMRRGQIVETGDVADVFARPADPCTRALIVATPRPGGGRIRLATASGPATVSAAPEPTEPDPTAPGAGDPEPTAPEARGDQPTAPDPGVLESVAPEKDRTAVPAPAVTLGAPVAAEPTPTARATALRLSEVTLRYAGRGGAVTALDKVSLDVHRGEIVALVGESGSGKSTLARCAARLAEPESGRIEVLGQDVTHLSRRRLRPLRTAFHMVVQNSPAAMNPRMNAAAIVAEPLLRHRVGSRQQRRERVRAMMERVGLGPELAARSVHQLSGGQRQRLGIARSLVLGPELLIADEPTSALDVTVQASVLALLVQLQQELGFSCLFVTHDLAVVEQIADRVAVMSGGRIVETGTTQTVLAAPAHLCTRALLDAAPVPDPVLQRARRAERAAVRDEATDGRDRISCGTPS